MKNVSNKKILIIDDEADILRLVSLRLKKLGYDILTANNGKDGLDSIRTNKPDLILLDLILPVISGEKICRQIKKDEELKHIPIILFTASDVSVADTAQGLGAEDYIAKPFDPQKLAEKVEKILTAQEHNPQ